MRTIPQLDQCNMLALAVFKLQKELGQASGRNLPDGDSATPCSNTTDRDDKCSVSVNQQTGPGVIYRDEWLSNIFRYVLAHEGGHCVGLCHYGHDGLQNIMFTLAKAEAPSSDDWGLFRFYLDSEPSSTISNAKNVWRFLVAEMVSCLDDPSQVEPVPIIL